MTPSDPRLLAAHAALKRHEFNRAIALFDEYLKRCPADVEAELVRGLACLMAGDEAGFTSVHDRLAPRLEQTPPTGGRLAVLWQTYRRAVQRFARAAAILALSAMPLALGGCPKDTQTTPPDRHPPARSVDAGATTPPKVSDAGAARPPAAEPDAQPPRPGPDASTGLGPSLTPPNVIRPKYGVRLRYRVARPHYRYGIRKPRTP